MDIIFKTGTCNKGALYTKIIDILKGAGWQFVSHVDTAKDYDVLNSTGEDGKKNLFINLKWIWGTDTTTNVKSGTGNIASIRLLKGYTKATSSSTAGKFNRAGEPYVKFMLAPDKLATDAIIEYKYVVNKDRLILVLYYPEWSNYKPIVHYIGIPDNVFLDKVGNNELMFASSLMWNDDDTVERGFSWVIDAPEEWPEKSLSEKNYSYNLLPPKSPNAALKYMLSKSYYGTDVYGIRAEFTGLYITRNESIHTKEIIKVEDKEFEVAVCHEVEGYVNSFGSSAIAYPIDRVEDEKALLRDRIESERLKLQELK